MAPARSSTRRRRPSRRMSSRSVSSMSRWPPSVMVERLGDQQPLARSAARRAPHHNSANASSRVGRNVAEAARNTAAWRSGAAAQLGLLDKAARLIDPGGVGHGAGLQEHEPRRAGDIGRRLEPGAARSRRISGRGSRRRPQSWRFHRASRRRRRSPRARCRRPRPATSAASVGSSARSLSCVAITTLSMSSFS